MNSVKIKKWISEDSKRMEALIAAATLGVQDWCLAAGFVRNLVWDKTHGFTSATPLNDIDLIYFDPLDAEEEKDFMLEKQLAAIFDFPWSVKNQARMHQRNLDNPYTSTEDAMSYWPELETAVGVRLDSRGEIIVVAPFGIDMLFDYTITLNSKRPKPGAFAQRISDKKWLEIWPGLLVNN